MCRRGDIKRLENSVLNAGSVCGRASVEEEGLNPVVASSHHCCGVELSGASMTIFIILLYKFEVAGLFFTAKEDLAPGFSDIVAYTTNALMPLHHLIWEKAMGTLRFLLTWL